jgi:hypothetical protein
MKIILIIIALIIFPKTGIAQTSLDALEDIGGVKMVVITEDAFELLSKFNPKKFKEGIELKAFQMAVGVKEFKLFSSKNSKIAKKMVAAYHTAVREKELTPIASSQDNSDFVKIYIKRAENVNIASSILLLIKEQPLKNKNIATTQIISFKGRIAINKIPKLVALFIEHNK